MMIFIPTSVGVSGDSLERYAVQVWSTFIQRQEM